MNDDTEDDLPTKLTRLLRNVDGVHTVYATKPLLPSIVGAVVEAVRNDPVGMHLVTVNGDPDELTIIACIGVSAEEQATIICRRAHDALRQYFLDQDLTPPVTIRVQVGRVAQPQRDLAVSTKPKKPHSNAPEKLSDNAVLLRPGVLSPSGTS